jgi:hypothetical protein
MSTKFSRDQFKPTNVTDLKKLKDTEDKQLGVSNNSKEFIEINEGSNKIRLAPKFPGEKDFYLMRMTHWGSITKNDGTLARVPILNSRIHGGTAMDIFEEYIAFAKKMYASDVEKIKILTDWKTGVASSVSWWAYGWAIKKDVDPKFGILEFKRNVRDSINSLSIIEDDDEAIECDPFTDPETGRSIIIKFDSKSKDKNKKYTVQLSSVATPLTDEMFDELVSKQPLSEIMRDVYTISDFEKGLEALRNFDIENEFEIFDEAEFLSIVKTVKAQYSKLPAKKSSKPSVEEEDEEEEKPVKKAIKDHLSKLDRDELKEYIEDNDLDVLVKKLDSDEIIRNKIREVEKPVTKTTKPSKVVEEEEEEEEEEEKPVKKVVKKPAKVEVVEEEEEDEEEEEETKPVAKTTKKIPKVEVEDDEEEEEEKPVKTPAKSTKKVVKDEEEEEEEEEKPTESKPKMSIADLRAKFLKSKKA